MRTLYRILALTAAFAVLVGCCNCRSYQRKNQRPLIGTTWQLIQLGGEKYQPSSDHYTLTLHADEQLLSGVGDCNRLTGRYAEGENRALHFTQLASTRMLCPDGAKEARYLEALEKTTHYDMDGPLLMLFSNGDLVAVMQAK